MGWRLRAAVEQEYRKTAPHSAGLGRHPGTGRRSGTPRQDAGRAPVAARLQRRSGPQRTKHVPSLPARGDREDRLQPHPEFAASAAVDEIRLRRRPDLFGHGAGLQSRALVETGQLQGSLQSQVRRKARHHRHPISVHHRCRRPCRRRLADQSRARQEASARTAQGRGAHLSDQRGIRSGAEDPGNRRRHHVEGAHGSVAERRHQGPVGCSGRRRTVLRVRLRDPEKCAGCRRRLCLSQRHVGPFRAGSLRQGHGLQPHRQQRGDIARAEPADRFHEGRDRKPQEFSISPT